jgi:hypothetical protein
MQRLVQLPYLSAPWHEYFQKQLRKRGQSELGIMHGT